MLTRQQVCKKIEDVFPNIGACGVNLDVDFDETNKAWVVDLRSGDHHLKTFLETSEAEDCVDGKECISLGLQIAQLRDNLGYIHNN